MPRYVADLHCDLLSYLRADPTRTPHHDEVRCSVEQLRAGRVRLQAMAIYSETKRGSSQVGIEQAEIFKLLPGLYPSDFQVVQSPNQLAHVLDSDRVGIIAAIENASSFCEEEGSLEEGFEHLRTVFGKVGRPLYISLTWNAENRFGGGSETTVGIKEDGKHLLDFLHDKQIAVDLSHASDTLAWDILSYISIRQLHIPVLASHSNVRSVAAMARNLPDELLQEIAKRGGVIGVNFVRPFVGTVVQEGFVAQLEALLKLVGEDHIGFGADFFFDGDYPKHLLAQYPDGWYFPEYADSSSYGRLMEVWRAKLGLSEAVLEKIAYRNVFRFISTLWGEAQVVASRGSGLDTTGSC